MMESLTTTARRSYRPDGGPGLMTASMVDIAIHIAFQRAEGEARGSEDGIERHSCLHCCRWSVSAHRLRWLAGAQG